MPDIEFQPTQPNHTSTEPNHAALGQMPQEPKQLPFFTSYCVRPKGLQFQNQEPDENILLFVRRHLITNLSWIFFALILSIIPTIFLFLPEDLLSFLFVIPTNFLIVFILFYYLIILGYILLNFISWFYNVGIITNQQVFDIDFTDIMYRNIAKVRVADIIDAEYTQGGFLKSFFNFGDVFIQTEGVKPNFEFHKIPHPDKVSDLIIDLKGATQND